jgi:ketosteroid isomerase-like protein
MRTLKPALFTVMLLCLPLGARAQHAKPAASTEIKAVMQKSAEDWNRGDLNAYVTCYKNSPDILLIGSTVERGYDSMLQTYRTYYGTKEKMGVLSYSEFEVQSLNAKFATATGHFHLERTAVGGGSADGFYLLVFEKTPQGWKIIRDDSTVIRPALAK